MITLYPSGGDDTRQIQNAIDSLPPTGGKIHLGAGRFLCGPLTMGNGSTMQESSRHGISIEGEGPGCIPGFCAPTEIEYIGPPGRIMVEMQGPVLGCSIKDVLLNGKGVCSSILWMGHVTRAVLRDVYMTGYASVGLICTTHKAGHHYGSGSNVFDNVSVVGPANENASGVLFDGMVTGLDTCSCMWLGGIIDYGGAPGSYGLKMAGADNNAFFRTHFCCYGFAEVMRKHGRLGPAVLLSEWQHDKKFPIENVAVACSAATNPTGSGAFGNMFLPLCEGDMADRSYPLPPGASGIRSMGGMFGDLARQEYAPPRAGIPGLKVVDMNGGTNGAGAIGFCRRGFDEKGNERDDEVGLVWAEYFDGLHLRFQGQDYLRMSHMHGGVEIWDGQRWRKPKFE